MSKRTPVNPLIPFERDLDEWMTTGQAAISFRKSRETIYRWCLNGTLREAGFETMKDLGGHWFIRVNGPREKVKPTSETFKLVKSHLG